MEFKTSIKNLDKSGVLAALKGNGNIHRYNGSDLWKRAFSLYKEDTGDNGVDTSCGRCYGKVKEWLEKL
jgi:hypothetical protein